MIVGTMFLGKVDVLGNESIRTKFVILGLPLFPISSHYVLEERANGINGFEIPIHPKSVLFGYVRLLSWSGAFITGLVTGILAYVEHVEHDHYGVSLWGWCALFSVVAVASTFALGRLSKQEKLRRGVLHLTTGVGAPPDLLPHGTRDSIAEKLVKAWDEAHEGKPWRHAAEGGATDPVLLALAEYHGERQLAAGLLDRMQKGGKTTSGQAYR